MTKKVAFDLDGIFIDKPPIIPKKLLEWLWRGGSLNRLSFRFPQGRAEQLIRRLSHFYLLRPPIKKNISYLRQLASLKKYQLILVSSRYSFLYQATYSWLKKRRINRCFDQIYLNSKNIQPHIFKQKTLTRLKPDIYFEDDRMIARYLRPKLTGTKVIFVKQKKLPPLPSILASF